MHPEDASQGQRDDFQSHPPIPCDACESILHSDGNYSMSFLLVDQLTVPLLGCDDHLEQFSSVCGFTTQDTAEILNHRPAGGVNCPSCHNAPYSSGQPLIPVQDGAVAVLACPAHQSEVVDRFHTGLDTQQQLTAPLNTS